MFSTIAVDKGTILAVRRDLPFVLQSTKVVMYADNTSISYLSKSIAEINEAVNSDLKTLQIWLEGNKLSLNVAKTQSIILASLVT